MVKVRYDCEQSNAPQKGVLGDMMENTNIDVLHGVWAAGNADRGEQLSSVEDQIIIGGQVVIDARTHRITATFNARTGADTQTTSRMVGQIRKVADERFETCFTNGINATFERLPNGHLTRTGYNGTTFESELTLAPVHDAITDTDQNAALLPPILFNTMPKSGSIFILRCLSRGLGIGETKIAVSLFPHDLVIRAKLDDLAMGNLISQQHLPAHDINLRFLEKRLDRMIVHVRDPRQALLSWLHHLDKFNDHRETEPACELGLEACTPALPDNYFDRRLSEKIDYLLETHFPQLIAWTEGWVDAADNAAGPDIHITTFEDFVTDPERFLIAILAYFDIPRESFDTANMPRKEAQTHFRKGLTDEWKTVFSKSQKDVAQKMISGELAKRFGW